MNINAKCRIEVFSLCENDWNLWADDIRPYNDLIKTGIFPFTTTHVGDGVLDVPPLPHQLHGRGTNSVHHNPCRGRRPRRPAFRWQLTQKPPPPPSTATYTTPKTASFQHLVLLTRQQISSLNITKTYPIFPNNKKILSFKKNIDTCAYSGYNKSSKKSHFYAP